MLYRPAVALSDAGARGLRSRSRRRSTVPARPTGPMDPDTRARKLARLERLRREVATLEQELGLGGRSPGSLWPQVHCHQGSACDASDGCASDACTSDEDSSDVGSSDEDSSDVEFSDEDAEEPLRLRGGARFTGPAGTGFWGGHPPIPSAPGLAHVHPPAQASGAAGGDLSVHPPIAHPNTLHCPPCSITVVCNCVSGQLGLGCCVGDDPRLGPGDLFNYVTEQRREASMTTNTPREGNNVQRKRMYRHCAVCATSSDHNWALVASVLTTGSVCLHAA